MKIKTIELNKQQTATVFLALSIILTVLGCAQLFKIPQNIFEHLTIAILFVMAVYSVVFARHLNEDD